MSAMSQPWSAGNLSNENPCRNAKRARYLSNRGTTSPTRLNYVSMERMPQEAFVDWIYFATVESGKGMSLDC